MEEGKKEDDATVPSAPSAHARKRRKGECLPRAKGKGKEFFFMFARRERSRYKFNSQGEKRRVITALTLGKVGRSRSEEERKMV